MPSFKLHELVHLGILLRLGSFHAHILQQINAVHGAVHIRMFLQWLHVHVKHQRCQMALEVRVQGRLFDAKDLPGEHLGATEGTEQCHCRPA